jgi:hypothetical protein
MSTSTATITTGPSKRSAGGRVRTTVAVGLGAAALSTAIAAAVHAAGVPLAVSGKMIPLGGFGQLTFVAAVVGGLIAGALDRYSVDAHHRFLRITVALTALSCVPSIAMPPDVATKLALVAMHVLAAAIIVPVLARQLHD